jgi:hypothetical protein
MGETIFLLSPARTTGERGKQLARPGAAFPLARQLQAGEARPLGEIFSFVSGLYFRGKLSYARRFGKKEAIWVITSNQGLLAADHPITLAEFQSFAEVEIDVKNESYRRPLEIDLVALARRRHARFIFLGSLASSKYAAIIGPILGRQTYSPLAFSGLGDMARGALLLRQVKAGQELDYAPWTKEQKKASA